MAVPNAVTRRGTAEFCGVVRSFTWHNPGDAPYPNCHRRGDGRSKHLALSPPTRSPSVERPFLL